jgi:hypothetical protein
LLEAQIHTVCQPSRIFGIEKIRRLCSPGT